MCSLEVSLEVVTTTPVFQEAMMVEGLIKLVQMWEGEMQISTMYSSGHTKPTLPHSFKSLKSTGETKL
jgi:hypothetical protein